MMSSSDKNDNGFTPFDVNNLEIYEAEQTNRRPDSKPDVERFHMLFEKAEFEAGESGRFEVLYEKKTEDEVFIFKPLIEIEDESEKNDSDQSDAGDSDIGEEELSLVPPEPEEPMETPEEKGYKDGFESGYADGLSKGLEQGSKDGFEKGRADGFEQGEKKGFEQGEIKGHKKGEESGRAAAEQEIREKAVEVLSSLEETLKIADSTLLLLVEKYEGRIINLIQQIAQKAILARLEIDDEIVKPMVLDALETLVEPEQIQLSVCEEDYEYIEMVKDDFFEQVESLENISVTSDATIKRGGCKIRTSTATIETDPMTRLQAIFEAIKTAGTK